MMAVPGRPPAAEDEPTAREIVVECTDELLVPVTVTV